MLTYEDIQLQVVDVLVPDSNPATVAAEPEFAKKVRSASVLLQQNNPVTYTDIRRAASGEYYRAALRIASKKFPQLNTLVQEGSVQRLQDESKEFTYQWLDDQVMAMLIPAGQGDSLIVDADRERLPSFSGGIEWAVSKLVAAHVIRTIPLQSNLKFVDIADNLETQALEDIDRISELSQVGSTSSSTSSGNQATGQYTLYIAHDLDLATIPEAAFDVPDPGSSPLTYDLPVSINNVATYTGIVVPAGKLSYCHVHMTAQTPIADQDLIGNRLVGNNQLNPQTSTSVSYSIRLNIPMQDGWTIDDIISELADNINSACLSAGSGNTTLSNILVAPNRGKQEAKRQSAIKGELYPGTATNVTRVGSFDLTYRLNSLDFTPRRYSAKVTTEMMTVTFFTVDDPDVINPDSPAQTYEYAGVGTADSLSLIKRNNPGFELGIEGLVHGPSVFYSSLDKVSPKGFFLTVEKGDKPNVSIESAGGSTSDTDSFANEGTENILDTFYFYGPSDDVMDPTYVFPANSILSLRVSTTEYNAALPTPIEIDLAGITVPLIGEQVAERVVDALYNYTISTNTDQDVLSNSGVLGVLLGDYQRIYTKIDAKFNTATEIPLEESLDINNQFTAVDVKGATGVSQQDKDALAGRVQIVGFKYKDNEYRAIVDILSVPAGLEVAIGNFQTRKTTWSTRRRSIQVDLKTLSASSSTVAQTTAEELASVNASVGKAEASKSQVLQKVYDKRRLLAEAKKGFPTKWHSQT